MPSSRPVTTPPLKIALVGVWFLMLNGLYLLGFNSLAPFYIANILLHALVGLLLAPVAWKLLVAVLRSADPAGRRSRWWATAGLLALAFLSGVALIIFGNYSATAWLLDIHILTSFLAAVLLVFGLLRLPALRQRAPRLWGWLLASIALVGIAIAANAVATRDAYTIRNPLLPPESLAAMAMGDSTGPFFPSPAATADGELIDARFFLESQSCGRSGCHVDLVTEWESSAHHFSSFNNQYYRKSIEYMQETVGTRNAQWCAGCHDPALLFSGQMDQPVADFLDKPEAHAGIGCVACHRIVEVKGTFGNGAYVIDYPAIHDLLASDNRFIRELHDFVLRLSPKPHRLAFNKPFHTDNTSEFCVSCHKVHLDRPVNNYRWVRGFNTYDNWQASGVSGEGARSFYYPAEPSDCADCHMPRQPFLDTHDRIRPVASHRFLAANTALPVANHDTLQLALTKAFLQSGKLRVDIFAAVDSERGRPDSGGARGAEGMPELSSTFAAGEEQGFAVGASRGRRPLAAITAPLRDGQTVFAPGQSVRLDVVVRTLNIGHFFPTGTIDAQEAWLELNAVDGNGRTIFHSGGLRPNGEVEPGAHFYRNIMLDADGNPINKRNAFMSRSIVYVNLIPPGAADVAHYRLDIPDDYMGDIHLVATLNYRKFNWWHNRWAYAGVRVDHQPDLRVSPDYDNGEWTFSGDLSTVSGKLKAIPELPVVAMAVDSMRLTVGRTRPDSGVDNRRTLPEDMVYWNDYGIGLLRTGDLRGAERAFRQVTICNPDYIDGWINLARVYLREGNLTAADSVLAEVARRDPEFPKLFFFRGLLHKANARYAEALADFQRVITGFPRDRVALNQLGRVHYLRGEPARAIPWFERTLAIDPEDLMAHYNLMLCYRAAGDADRSTAHEARYLRYKADENAAAIARQYLADHPHDNNEAQPIHEHASMPLP